MTAQRCGWRGLARAIGLALALAAGLARATGAEALQARLDARFKGDRSGACVVAALIDKAQVLRAASCARPRDGGAPGFDSVFEIGSVSKTLTAYLAADLIRQGKWSLDDPLVSHLPPGSVLPRQGERQILLRDVFSHTAGLPGLPPGFIPKDPADPYAELSERALLDAAARATLQRPIGSEFEYSNFAMMLMSLAVARGHGADYETALVKRLFEPLGMDGAYVDRPRNARPLAGGHLSSGRPAANWHAAANLAGVGMVRATLSDMTRYAQAHLGQADAEVLAGLRLSQQPLTARSAMSWMRLEVQGHALLVHEGATGGYAALVALEPAAQRAVVILADTSLIDLGGLGKLGRALLDIDPEPLRPRLAATPSAEMLAALPGDYLLGGLPIRLWLDGQRLMAQAQGQSAFELKFDSEGDFYPEGFSALLSPEWRDGKLVRAVWRQGGGALPMLRRGAAPDVAPATASDPRWQHLAGEYLLTPQFSLSVFERDGVLMVQGSGQAALPAEQTDTDSLEVKAVAAVIEFRRDASGQVSHAVLKQGGQVLVGPRRAAGGPAR